MMSRARCWSSGAPGHFLRRYRAAALWFSPARGAQIELAVRRYAFSARVGSYRAVAGLVPGSGPFTSNLITPTESPMPSPPINTNLAGYVSVCRAMLARVWSDLPPSPVAPGAWP
jgi:hypothetical protein